MRSFELLHKVRMVYQIVAGGCLLVFVSTISPSAVGQQVAGDLRLIETVTINRTQPDSAGCWETATGLNDQWRGADRVFTDFSNLGPPFPFGFFLHPADFDHMEIYVPENVHVDRGDLALVESAIEILGRPTIDIRLVGWSDRHLKHHSGKEFLDLIDASTTSPADLRGAYLQGLRFNGFLLRNVDFSAANLSGASLCHIWPGSMLLNFTNANLNGASLANSDLTAANFTDANLSGTDLSKANLNQADLTGAIFEPSQLPDVGSFASAKNIDRISYGESPEQISKMKKELDDANLHAEARELVFALNETEDERLLHSCRRPDAHEIALMLNGLAPLRRRSLPACAQYTLRKIAFDKTNAYGMKPARPLLILGVVWAVGSILYFGLLQKNWGSGLSIQVSKAVGGASPGIRIIRLKARYWSAKERRPTRKLWKRIRRIVRDQGRLASAATFFSLTSVTALGFREWNPGQWLNLVIDRDYILVGRGWVRRLGGIQALLSLYLLVLLVLSFFNLPFG